RAVGRIQDHVVVDVVVGDRVAVAVRALSVDGRICVEEDAGVRSSAGRGARLTVGERVREVGQVGQLRPVHAVVDQAAANRAGVRVAAEVDAIRVLCDGAVAGGEVATQRLHRDVSGIRRGRDEDRGAADGGGRDGLDPAHARGTPWSWSADTPRPRGDLPRDG